LTGCLIREACFLDRHPAKLDEICRLELAEAIEIGRDYMGDVRIPAHGAAGDAQDDELTTGHLDRAWRDGT
jgi:hypothetical protein